MTRACPLSGASAVAIGRRSGAAFSTREISRASARGSPALAFPIASRARSAAFNPFSLHGLPRGTSCRRRAGKHRAWVVPEARKVAE